MVIILTGAAGYGKTTVAVKMLHEFINKHGDYEIVTNTPLKSELFVPRIRLGFFKYEKVPCKINHVSTKEEWYEKLKVSKKAIHFIDEGGVWCNAYNFKMIPDIVYEKLNQVRHNELHLIVTCKKFKHVYTRLRENSDAVIIVNRFPKPRVTDIDEPKKPWLIWWDYYDIDMFDLQGGWADPEVKDRYRLGRRWLFNMKSVMNTFDTKYNIGWESQKEQKSLSQGYDTRLEDLCSR